MRLVQGMQEVWQLKGGVTAIQSQDSGSTRKESLSVGTFSSGYYMKLPLICHCLDDHPATSCVPVWWGYTVLQCWVSCSPSPGTPPWPRSSSTVLSSSSSAQHCPSWPGPSVGGTCVVRRLVSSSSLVWMNTDIANVKYWLQLRKPSTNQKVSCSILSWMISSVDPWGLISL